MDLEQFDVVFCRYSRTLAVLPKSVWQRVVLDADDLAYRLQFQAARRDLLRPWNALVGLDACRAYLYEQTIFRSVARTLVCSKRDLRRIRCKRKSVVFNGVALPDTRIAQAEAEPCPKLVIFVGNFIYTPNLEGLRWFVARVWPLVRDEAPDAQLNVVGRGSSSESMRFACQPGIRIVGTVEETVSWFSQATLSVVPLWSGAGTRIKILESLACGRPVVSTVLGADALDYLQENHGVFRHNSPQAMARRIVSILKAPCSALHRAERGRQLVNQRFSWEQTTATLADDIERWIPAYERRTS